MPILFGWGFQTNKDYGPAFKNNCNHCNNDEYWRLSRTMTWFTLFFIPVIPYKIHYFLMCPICSFGVSPKGEDLEKIKLLAETNTSLINGTISVDEYHAILNPSIYEKRQKQPTITQSPSVSEKAAFCTQCGDPVIHNANYCNACGTKIPIFETA